MRVGAVAWLVNGERQRNRSLLRTVFSMLRGHVDQITRRLVVGWALDDEKPDAVVDICLFVDGVNIAQVPCNIVRPDLRDARRYGEGRHGFRYEFASEFPPETQPRITLRFAATGGLLGNGDAVLAGGQAAATVPTDGQNVRLAANDARLRPLDWPPIAVDVRASDKLLSAMIERVESMFRHLGEVDPSESGAVADRYLAALITERDAAFFEFGKMPVRQFLATLARCGISKNGLDTCFELGCGVGRSTVWLAEQFRQVIAADISAPHLRATRENVGRFGRDNVTFVHTNKIDSLRELPPLERLLFHGCAAAQSAAHYAACPGHSVIEAEARRGRLLSGPDLSIGIPLRFRTIPRRAAEVANPGNARVSTAGATCPFCRTGLPPD